MAWGAHVASAPLYWVNVAAVLGAAVVAFVAGRAVWQKLSTSATPGLTGLATRPAIKRAAGRKALVKRAAQIRPLRSGAEAEDLGIWLGQASGVGCWSSIEDSLLVLGPPRSGKGLHLAIPAILDAPGAVITTSTRPDNLAVTLKARKDKGQVAIFDPQGLAVGVESVLRWSPIRGCEVPAVAMARARALCAQPADGVENASFWSQQCYTVVRCLLHAAALSGEEPIDLLRWSLSPLAAEGAAEILRLNPGAAPTWSTAFEAILTADFRQRDSVWAMVSNTFSALADPAVLAAVSPGENERFDPATFLTKGGTLFLLGTATGASAAATLISALIEDVVETARRLAARSPGGRLEPPLSVVLDEAANYPLPSLLPLMSEGGGSGISTMVVLQSLAQARARWGIQEAAAIWDAAIVKLVFGGSASADDLRDISALAGTREKIVVNESWSDGRRSSTRTRQEVPVLETGLIRTLPFGQAILLLRSAPPIRLVLRPWTRRRDASSLTASRTRHESLAQQHQPDRHW